VSNAGLFLLSFVGAGEQYRALSSFRCEISRCAAVLRCGVFELVFLSGPCAGTVHPVVGPCYAGRSPGCEIEVRDPNVSRQHSRFEFDGTHLRVFDCGSSNGTYVNEEPISEYQLADGDIVRLGETRIRVRHIYQDFTFDDGFSTVFGFNDDGAFTDGVELSSLRIPSAAGPQIVDNLSVRLDAVMWVAEQLASFTKLDDLFAPVLATLFEVFPQAERGFLMLGDDYEKLVPKAMRQRSPQAGEKLAVSSTLCREALRRKEVIIYTDGSSADFDQGASIMNLNIRSAMVVPLMVKGEVLGLLVIDTTDAGRAFSQGDMELAAAVCRQIAIAIKNAMLLKQVEVETRTRSNLMRFLPRPVVDQAVKGDIDLRLGGSTYRGTIVFSDVIGFTQIAEQLSPEEVVAMMNGFFNRMVPCIETESGAIDKFMGDCIMAFWGIPFDGGDATRRAVAAGLTMQNVLIGLNSERCAEGRESLSMGIGLDTGTVVAGNIGSEDRVEYTVLGNTVNTAQRIQAQACRNQVLVGESAFGDVVSQVAAIRMPPVKVKNKAEAVTIYSLRGIIAENEWLLHMPVRIGDQRVFLIRRLSSGLFILLHAEECDPEADEWMTDFVELPPTSLGCAQIVECMPQQRGDGHMCRTLVQLFDTSVGGVIGREEVFVSPLRWDQMVRSRTPDGVETG